jgi:tetratricopeptide (TPR) repeat protein
LSEHLDRGNEAYHNGNHNDAERFYNNANISSTPHQLCALINLNVVLGEQLYKFPESVEVNLKRLNIDKSEEAKTNLAESLLRVGKYEQARKYALEVMNAPEYTIGERDSHILYQGTPVKGYKTINTFFILCSYLLSGDKTSARKELDNLKSHIMETSKFGQEEWIFKGLRKSVKDSNVNGETKNVILAIIDSLEGQTSKEEAIRKAEEYFRTQ